MMRGGGILVETAFFSISVVTILQLLKSPLNEDRFTIYFLHSINMFVVIAPGGSELGPAYVLLHP